MKPLSRRAVTTGLAAAVTAIPAVGLCVGAESASELPGLIKAHRAAYRAFCNAIRRREKLEEAYKATDVVVPCLLGDAFSLSYGRQFCEEHLVAEYRRQRASLERLSRIAPDLAEQARAALDAKEAENMAILDSMVDEEEARRESFGLAEAEREWDRTEDAEHEAAIAVCAYRCRALEEARIKAEYLATVPSLRDLMNEHVNALLQSFRGEAAA